jgi:hypothetical protein
MSNIERVNIDTEKMRMAVRMSGYRTDHITNVTGVSASTLGRCKTTAQSVACMRLDQMTQLLDFLNIPISSVEHVRVATVPAPPQPHDAPSNYNKAIVHIMDHLGITWNDVLGDPETHLEIF